MSVETLMKRYGITQEELDRANAATDAYIEAYNLRQARRERDLTQKEVAAAMHVSQKRISELERGEFDSLRLGTLRRYVESLGGKLVANAVFPEKTIHLAG